MTGVYFRGKLVFTLSKSSTLSSVIYTLKQFPKDTWKRKLFIIVCFIYAFLRKVGIARVENSIESTLRSLPYFRDKDVSFVVWSNSESGRVRYYVNVFDAHDKCICFGKISYEEYRYRLDTEYRNLKLLSEDKSKPFQVPKPLYFASLDSYTVLLVEPIGREFKKEKFDNLSSKAQILDYFKSISDFRSIPAHQYLDEWICTKELLNSHPEFTCCANIELGFCHMDIGSENIFLGPNNDVLIIDWEYSAQNMPVKCDLVASWMGANSLRIKNDEISLSDFKERFFDGKENPQYLIALIYYAVNDFFLAKKLLGDVKKRILRISSSYYPAISMGGPVTADYAFDLLSSELNSIQVITTNSGIESEVAPLETRIFNDIKVTYFPYLLSRNITMSVSLLMSLIKNARDFDIVHISGVWNLPVLLAPFICRTLGVKYIITPHGSIYPEKLERKHSSLKRIIIKIMVSNSFRNAHKLQVATDDEKLGISKLIDGLSNISVVPFPLSNTVFSERKTRKVKGLLFVGRLSYIKGLDILIPAYLSLLDDYDYLDLYIAGYDEDNMRAKLEHDIPPIYRSRIRWLGSQSQSQLDDLYKQDFIFVLPSYSENYGMVVIEAAARSMPIVLSDKVGLSKVFLDNDAAIVCATEVDSLVESIRSLIDSKLLRESISTNAGLLFRTQFSNPAISEKIFSLYGD